MRMRVMRRSHPMLKMASHSRSQVHVCPSCGRLPQSTITRIIEDIDVLFDAVLSNIRHEVFIGLHSAGIDLPGYLSDFCDGSVYKRNSLFTSHRGVLQIMLYYDDLEICNPLGLKRKKHKLGEYL